VKLTKVSIQASLPERPCFEATLASVRESDVGVEPVIVGPAGYSIEHFLASLDMLRSDDPAAIVVRLEDDVFLNRYLRHNLEAWTVYEEDDFGIGWLFQSQMDRMHGLHQEAVCGSGGQLHYRSLVKQKCCSQGIVMRAADITDALFERIRGHWEHCEHQQDRALSLAMWDVGKKGYLHDPPLVEHNITVRSALAPDRDPMPGMHSAGMFFNADWRRA